VGARRWPARLVSGQLPWQRASPSGPLDSFPLPRSRVAPTNESINKIRAPRFRHHQTVNGKHKHLDCTFGYDESRRKIYQQIDCRYAVARILYALAHARRRPYALPAGGSTKQLAPCGMELFGCFGWLAGCGYRVESSERSGPHDGGRRLGWTAGIACARVGYLI
jgi:hypothetical protein